MIAADQHLAAAYYRNTVIHYFVNGAIAELALLRAAEDDVRHRRREFWDEALRLRDLLKFEFFFTDKDVFRERARRRGGAARPALGEGLRSGARGAGRAGGALQAALTPTASCGRSSRRTAWWPTRCVRRDPTAPSRRSPFLRECLALGRQYALQRRIEKQESVSKVLFASALELARNRGLCDPATPDLAGAPARFAHELREVIRRVDGVQALVRARQAGVQI